MSKGKHKHKREHRQAAEEKHPAKLVLPKPAQQTEHPSDTQAARKNEQEPLMGFWERLGKLWNQCSLTDRIIAVFTAVLAGAAIYQFIVMNGQLDTMRKDQRAWVSLSAGDPQIAKDPVSGSVTISWPLVLKNTGKSLARHSSVEVVVDTVRNGEAPVFAYDKGITSQADAVVFPNDSIPVVGRMLHKTKVPNHPEETILTKPEYQDLLDGTQYVIVYARSSYLDIFKTEHWQHFCGFKSLATKPISIEGARVCTNYNDVDDKE